MQTQPITQEKSRVLVVDDESQITRVLRTVLTSHGYQVRTAAEGEAALTDFKEWSPELVITDLYMPHMNGVELCRRIRQLTRLQIEQATDDLQIVLDPVMNLAQQDILLVERFLRETLRFFVAGDVDNRTQQPERLTTSVAYGQGPHRCPDCFPGAGELAELVFQEIWKIAPVVMHRLADAFAVGAGEQS